VGPEGAPVAVRDGLRDAHWAMQRLAERTRVDLDDQDA
jgi:hypothetical protein